MVAQFRVDPVFDARPRSVPLDLRTGLERVRTFESGLNERFVNRKEVIRVLLYSLLSGHHALMLGRTGTAKSLLANQILDALGRNGSRVFRIKASIDDTKDNYFGPIDVLAYRDQGLKTRRVERSLLEADFAFVDEIFDTNEQVLRDLMLILSDRVLQEGPVTYQTPLRTVFAACNYLRVNEVTEAVLDRFLYKVVIPQDESLFSQLQIDFAVSQRAFDVDLPFVDQGFVERVARIARGESEEAQVAVPTRILLLKSIILNAFVARMRKTKPDYYVSPRRQARMLDLLRLEALLNGRDEVNEADLKSLRYMAGILNGDQRETDAFDRTVEEMMRYFEVDPRLKATTDLLSTAFDVARAPAIEADDWTGLQRLSQKVDAKEELKARPSFDALYRFLDRLSVPFVPLDELRRGCLDVLKTRAVEM